jgi:HD superfamily phosphohydrolase
MPTAAVLRQALQRESPTLWAQLNARVGSWIGATLDRLESGSGSGYPKTFNDPIWGDIKLFPWETLLLDSPILQRLRHVRQLGMAHMVYPGAGYDRLEHSRGVVEASERMIASLERNASFRRRFGRDRDETIPLISESDRNAIRLAALLHDTGHAAFSHATEEVVARRLSAEFDAVNQLLRQDFDGVKSVAPAEVISIVMIMSASLRPVFEHVNFNAWNDNRGDLPVAIVARIIGARDHLDAGYLSGVISGPLDADKLDYMARDSHHAGLPIGLDLHRLISKLEIVTIRPDTATNPELRNRARSSPDNKFHEIGISLSGLGAFEQMMIARVILYDRLYYHHKIRSAEAMVRRLILVAEEERGDQFRIDDFFTMLPDDSFVAALGGQVSVEGFRGGANRSKRLADAITKRQLHYRAFAFASRFLAGVAGLPDAERNDTRVIIWRQILSRLSTQEDCDAVARKIVEKAVLLRQQIDDFHDRPEPSMDDVVVDLALNKSVARGGDMLTRTEDGHVAPPFLFFDPERWSHAYESQKQCGFVFTPRKFVKLIGLASRIVFYEEFHAVMSPAADRASKTSGDITAELFQKAADANLCSRGLQEIYSTDKPHLAFVTVQDLRDRVPNEVQTAAPELCNRLAHQLVSSHPGGFPASTFERLLDFIEHAYRISQSLFANGDLKTDSIGDEKALQTRLMQYFRDAGVSVSEGSEVNGGETDIVLREKLVIENKLVKQETRNPHGIGPNFAWQGRRYSVSVAQTIIAEFVAYKPADESAILETADCLSIKRITADNEFVVLRCVLPWNYGNPSAAKAP